jgi:hypothetical protein
MYETCNRTVPDCAPEYPYKNALDLPLQACLELLTVSCNKVPCCLLTAGQRMLITDRGRY